MQEIDDGGTCHYCAKEGARVQVSVRLTSSLVSLFSLSRGSCLTCVAMAKAARSWLSAKLMTLVMEGSMDPWQLVPMIVFRSHTASSSYQTHSNAWKLMTHRDALFFCYPTFFWQGMSEKRTVYLNALFDPEVAAHGLPVLRAAGVEQPLVHAALHGGIKHLEELCSDERLGAAKAWQEGWFQLGCNVTSWEAFIPVWHDLYLLCWSLFSS